MTSALREILATEVGYKSALGYAQRGAATWMVDWVRRSRSRVDFEIRMRLMLDRMRVVMMERAELGWAFGWGVASGRIARARKRAGYLLTNRGEGVGGRVSGVVFDDRGPVEGPPEVVDAAPGVPAGYKRVYAGTVDDALHRYEDRIRRRLGALTQRAASEGMTVNEITSEVRAIAQGLKTWEAERIARTETMRLWNAGSFVRMEAEDADLIGYRYDATLDDRTSGICRPIDGHVVRRGEVRRVPPLHPHCRTVMEPVFSFDDDVTDGAPIGGWNDGDVPTAKGFGEVPVGF